MSFSKGDTVQLKPLGPAVPDGTVPTYVWTQIEGTSIEFPDANSETPIVQLPEVFVREDLVFEVTIDMGGTLTKQLLTVRVEPVEDVVRPDDAGITRIDESSEFVTNEEETETKPGVGKLWAALLAFLQSGRRR